MEKRGGALQRAAFFCGEFCGQFPLLSTGKNVNVLTTAFHRESLRISTICGFQRWRELRLLVMSRTVLEMSLSVWIMPSIFLMEASTVAWSLSP